MEKSTEAPFSIAHEASEAIQLHLGFRHASKWLVPGEKSNELLANVVSAHAIAIMRHATLFVLANAHASNLSALLLLKFHPSRVVATTTTAIAVNMPLVGR